MKDLRNIDKKFPSDFEEALSNQYPSIDQQALQEIKEMINISLDHQPAKRASAEDLLKKYHDKAFIQSLGNMLDPSN